MFIEGKNKLRILAAWSICFILLLCAIWYLRSLIIHKTSLPPQRSSLEPLKSLPYITWAPISKGDRNKAGVTRYDPELSCNGINIYQSEIAAGGFLLDMSGNAIHAFSDKQTDNTWWKLIEPYQGNDFLVIIENRALRMIDWDSNIKWTKEMDFHHDVAVDDKGVIYSITQEPRIFPEYSVDEPILDNYLVILTKNGEIIKKISFADMIMRDKTLFDIARNPPGRVSFRNKAWDIFHTNTIEVIDRDIFYKNKNLFTRLFRKKINLFKKGDVLF